MFKPGVTERILGGAFAAVCSICFEAYCVAENAVSARSALWCLCSICKCSQVYSKHYSREQDPLQPHFEINRSWLRNKTCCNGIQGLNMFLFHAICQRVSSIVVIMYRYYIYVYIYTYIYIYIYPMALRPDAGHGLLILEVSRSHTTTHHSR
jgi:hypothetical protein